jgi:hypothetical protein
MMIAQHHIRDVLAIGTWPGSGSIRQLNWSLDYKTTALWSPKLVRSWESRKNRELFQESTQEDRNPQGTVLDLSLFHKQHHWDSRWQSVKLDWASVWRELLLQLILQVSKCFKIKREKYMALSFGLNASTPKLRCCLCDSFKRRRRS